MSFRRGYRWYRGYSKGELSSEGYGRWDGWYQQAVIGTSIPLGPPLCTTLNAHSTSQYHLYPLRGQAIVGRVPGLPQRYGGQEPSTDYRDWSRSGTRRIQ